MVNIILISLFYSYKPTYYVIYFIILPSLEVLSNGYTNIILYNNINIIIIRIIYVVNCNNVLG